MIRYIEDIEKVKAIGKERTDYVMECLKAKEKNILEIPVFRDFLATFGACLSNGTTATIIRNQNDEFIKTFKNPNGRHVQFKICLDKEDYHLCVDISIIGVTADEYLNMSISGRGIRFLWDSDNMKNIRYAYISEFTDNKAIASGPVISCHDSGDGTDYTIFGLVHPQITRHIKLTKPVLNTAFDMIFEYLPKYCETCLERLELHLKTYIKTWEIMQKKKRPSQEG